MVFVRRTMKIVRSAFGHHGHLSTRGTPLIGVVVRCGDTEFLHRVQRYRQHRGESVSVLIIHLDAIHGNVALVAA